MNNEMIFSNGEGFYSNDFTNYENPWGNNFNYNNKQDYSYGVVNQGFFNPEMRNNSINQMNNDYQNINYNYEACSYKEDGYMPNNDECSDAKYKFLKMKEKIVNATTNICDNLTKHSFVAAPIVTGLYLLSKSYCFKGSIADKAYVMVLVLQLVMAIAGAYFGGKLKDGNYVAYKSDHMLLFVIGYVVLSGLSNFTAAIAPVACLVIVFMENKKKYFNCTEKEILTHSLTDVTVVLALAVTAYLVLKVVFVFLTVGSIFLEFAIGIALLIILLPHIIRYSLYYRG